MNKTLIGETGMHPGIDPKPTCSIVIRAYNEEKHIGQLLDGIAAQTLKDVEIVLVDSGSTDATIRIATSMAGQLPINVVRIKPEEFTFGYSLNNGIEQTRGEFIIIASAHVYPVYPDWLARLLEPFNDTRTGLVYGKQRGNSKTHFSERQVFASWYPDEGRTRQNHPFCNNANAAIRRSLWEEQPYDETLSGLEDLAWAKWLLGQGYLLSYVPEAEVVHVHEERPRDVYNRYRREAMAFKHIFPQEKFGLSDFLRLYSTNVSSDLLHALREKQFVPNLLGILWFRMMQFWGTYQGYRQSGPLTWSLRKTFYYPRGIAPTIRPEFRELEPIQYNDEVEP